MRTQPIYIVYDREDAYPGGGYLRTGLSKFLTELATASAPVVQIFEAGGWIRSVIDIKTLSECTYEPRERVGSSVVLQHIVRDLEANPDWLEPWLLYFFRAVPSDEFLDELGRVSSERPLRAHWIPRESLDVDRRTSLEQRLGDRVKLEPDARDDEGLREVLASLLNEPSAAQPAQKVPEVLGSGDEKVGTKSTPPESPPEVSVEPSPNPAIAPLWTVRDPAPELGDRREHTETARHPNPLPPSGWALVGVSDRGKLHAHEGTFREDAFGMETTLGWNLIAVADGAGSHPLSRVGSELAVRAAISSLESGLAIADFDLRQLMGKALQAARAAIDAEAAQRAKSHADFGTTLLLLAHNTANHTVGVAQVGDGLLAVQMASGAIRLLGSPESGEYSGLTSFLTSHRPSELPARTEVVGLEGEPRIFLVMTDGIADDLYPPEQRLGGLLEPLPGVLSQDDPEAALLRLIRYERTGSFDDRTLVVAYRVEDIQLPVPAPE